MLWEPELKASGVLSLGPNPSPSVKTLVVVTFNSSRSGLWSGRIVDRVGQTLTLGITPTAKAIVGKFFTYVDIMLANGVLRTKRDRATDLYLLFNAWAKGTNPCTAQYCLLVTDRSNAADSAVLTVTLALMLCVLE